MIFKMKLKEGNRCSQCQHRFVLDKEDGWGSFKCYENHEVSESLFITKCKDFKKKEK